jgi:hypothetical protein
LRVELCGAIAGRERQQLAVPFLFHRTAPL